MNFSGTTISAGGGVGVVTDGDRQDYGTGISNQDGPVSRSILHAAAGADG